MPNERFMSSMQFAAACGVSLPALTKAKKKGRIILGEDRFFDTLHPMNKAYLEMKMAQPAAGQGSSPEKKPAEVEKVAPVPGKRGRGRPRKDEPAQVPVAKTIIPPYDGVDIENMDLTSMDKIEVDKLKVIEAIDSARLKNDQLRRTLIDRELVRAVLGKIHTVDVQEFLAIPIRFSPIAAGIFGRDDEEIIHALEKSLTAELYKCLNHVKRIIDDFLNSLEDELSGNEPEA